MMVGKTNTCVKDGQGTAFWTDRWIDQHALLIDHVREEASSIEPSLLVAAFIGEQGAWNESFIEMFLIREAAVQVLVSQPPREDAGEDEAF
ncbi:unnamed protein product [Linum trigynum]|uniref:Uncharacterized protein n=1 Tax=Linum trigynum TaxID=586398 RepID=A0AAV2CMG2_9ROSI